MEINKLQRKIDYEFTDIRLLYEALTHPSARKAAKNYERLEFLGNAILGAALADMIFHNFPKMHEGSLSVIQSKLASTDGIVQAAAKLEITQYMFFNYSEEKNGGKSNPHNIENCVEAIIGAIYIDGGYDAAKDFVYKFWSERLLNANDLNLRDPKSRLQELCQQHGPGIPVYELISKEGPVHAPTFKVSSTIHFKNKVFTAEGEGNTKKLAEKNCAEKLLKMLQARFRR